MFIIRILNFLKGYIIFTAEGFFLERFLNIAAHRNIYLWDIRRLGTAKMRMRISTRGFTKIREVAEKTQSHVEIISKRGIPFFIKKYRGRTAFAVGLAVFFVIVFVLSFFIWAVDIDYEGTRVHPNIVRAELYSAGLKAGTPTFLINKQSIASQLMTNIPEFSWVGINIQGTRAIIQIKERAIIPEVEDLSVPCNIKAKRAGIIDSISTRLGEQLVQKGLAVTEGQLLVNGVVDSNELGVRYLHATADIIARTWLTSSAIAEPTIEIRTQTGRTKSKHTLDLFGFNIRLFTSDKVEFAEYDRVSEIRQIRLSQNLVLPFALHYDKFYEVDKINQPINENESIAGAKAKIIADLYSKLTPDAQVLGEELTTSTTSAGELLVTVTLECLENIGQKEEILH
ncbi:sporulation protein YqfD [Clostridia bacterium]|nr:sporulation protein YqfD [Clostridia bacterium]